MTKEKAEQRLEEMAIESREGYSLQTWSRLLLPLGMLARVNELDELLATVDRPFPLKAKMYVYALCGEAVKAHAIYMAGQSLFNW